MASPLCRNLQTRHALRKTPTCLSLISAQEMQQLDAFNCGIYYCCPQDMWNFDFTEIERNFGNSHRRFLTVLSRNANVTQIPMHVLSDKIPKMISIFSVLTVILSSSIFHIALASEEHRFVINFPSYALPSADPRFSLTLRVSGIAYTQDEGSVNIPTAVGHAVSFDRSERISFMQRMWHNDIEISETSLQSRLQLFIAEPVDKGQITIRLKIVSRPADLLYNWGFFAMHTLVDDNVIGQDFVVDVERNGYFSRDIPVHSDPSRVNENGTLYLEQPLAQMFWLETSMIDPLTGRRFLTFCPMQIGGANDIRVISDIDDTIKDTKVRESKRKLFKSTLFQNYDDIPGMQELYRSLVQKAHLNGTKMTMHFVSGSSWQASAAYINDLVLKHKYPLPSYDSRTDLTFRTESFFTRLFKGYSTVTQFNDIVTSDPREQTGTFKFKTWCIGRMVNDSPQNWKRINFFGDSTESDPEVYAFLVSKFGFYNDPGRIQCVFIRHVFIEDGDETIAEAIQYGKTMKRVAEKYGKFPGWKNHVRVFRNGTELMDLDLDSNRCHSASSVEMWKDF